jgi:hypothetical protein
MFYGVANHFCSNFNTSPCSTAHTDSLVGIIAGGGVAATGFYFQFHR